MSLIYGPPQEDLLSISTEALIEAKKDAWISEEHSYVSTGKKLANKTHFSSHADLKKAIANLKNKVRNRGNLPHLTVKEQYLIIDDLSSFSLGCHICLAAGSDGRWTDYIISPDVYLKHDLYDRPSSIIECFLLFHSPVVLAQRELVKLVQRIAQGQLADGKVLASIPCGMMRDLLTLDFSSTQGQVSLVGIDIDPRSIEEGKKLAKDLNVKKVNFLEKDAWHLNCESEFDFISSIGLNMYESSQKKVIALYRQLYEALKPDGVLVTGVLTWPPYLDACKSDWILDTISPYTLHLERVVHKDILDIKWLNCRKLSEIKADFKEAGFSKIEILPDSRLVFPAVIAEK